MAKKLGTKARQSVENGGKPPTRNESKELRPQEMEKSGRIVFEWPEMPKWEMRCYYAFMVGLFAYCAYVMIDVTAKYNWTATLGRYEDVDLPFFGLSRKDVSNNEWRLWKPISFQMVVAMTGHSILFEIANRRLINTKHHFWGEFLTLAYSVAASSAIFGCRVVLAAIISGVVIFSATRVLGSDMFAKLRGNGRVGHFVYKVCVEWKMVTWLIALPVLWYCLHEPTMFDKSPFLVLVFMSYKLLQYLSYNLEYLDEKSRQDLSQPKALFNMFYYAFYFPYLISLIVVYPSFQEQLEKRRSGSKVRDWRHICFFGFRMCFWYIVCDLLLYFIHFEAIVLDVNYLSQIPLDRLCIVGMALGQFFHLKYVVIFGLNSLFAKLDGMEPLAGPLCITRVMLYSKVWRAFDRGLYVFFKRYIFLPICQPTFSVPRKMAGVLLSYAFVLVWHGIDSRHLIWIGLNITEIFLEATTKGVYVSWHGLRTLRERYISDQWFRRILATFFWIPYALGLYSNFFFLGGLEAGHIYVNRFFWNETMHLRWPHLMITSIGYVNAMVAMEVDKLLSEKQKREEHKQKNE